MKMGIRFLTASEKEMEVIREETPRLLEVEVMQEETVLLPVVEVIQEETVLLLVVEGDAGETVLLLLIVEVEQELYLNVPRVQQIRLVLWMPNSRSNML
jgi:hypothetical protein